MKKLLLCALLVFAAALPAAKASDEQSGEKSSPVEEHAGMVSQYKAKLTPEQTERVREIHRRYHKEIAEFAKENRKKEHDEIFNNVLNDEQRAEYNRVKAEKKQKLAEIGSNRGKERKTDNNRDSFRSYIVEYQKAKENFKQSLSAEQRRQIDEINGDFYAKVGKDFKELQEKHREKTKEWREEADKKIASLLNDDQKKQFETMNDKIKIMNDKLTARTEKFFAGRKLLSQQKAAAASDKKPDKGETR